MLFIIYSDFQGISISPLHQNLSLCIGSGLGMKEEDSSKKRASDKNQDPNGFRRKKVEN